MSLKITKSTGISLVFILSACATPASYQWIKQGASDNDFAKDRYACLQESQQRVSGSYVNRYGGSSSNTVVTNETLFESCMNSRGWRLQRVTKQDQSSPKNREVAEAAAFKYQSIIERSKEVCADPSYEAFYTKSPCKPTDATLAQLSDTSRVTPQQKKTLDLLTPALQQNNRDLVQWYRTYGGQNGNARAAVVDLIFEKAEANRLNLYSGKITWGEFNKKRKEIINERDARMSQIK